MNLSLSRSRVLLLGCCSAVLAIILGAYAWSQSSRLFLPLPISLVATTTFLPIITGFLAIAATRAHWRRRCLTDNNALPTILDQVLTIIPAVLATFALSYLAPACRLEEQWKDYFRSKNADAIRSIQDRLQCCGFNTIHDRAWPFPGGNVEGTCESTLGYTRSCRMVWRSAEENAAAMVFLAAFLAWTLKLTLFYQHDRPDHRVNFSNSQRSIEQAGDPNTRPIAETPYSDEDGIHAAPDDQNATAPNSVEQGMRLAA